MDKLADIVNPGINESISALAKHTDITGMIMAQKHLDLAMESFTKAITTAYGERARQAQEDFVAAISQAEVHIEKWLGKQVYFHLLAERKP